jgi:hypothetical protein
MRYECYGCKKSFSGSGLTVSLNGEERTYCADCLWTLRKEYDKKKNCEDCGYFNEESCEKIGKALVPVKVGYSTYLVQAEICKDYSTEKKASSEDNEPFTLYKVGDEVKTLRVIVDFITVFNYGDTVKILEVIPERDWHPYVGYMVYSPLTGRRIELQDPELFIDR